MAVRGSKVSKNFDKIKKANPGMSDSEAMQKAINASSKQIASARSDAKKKKKARKVGWVEKLAMGVTKELKSKRHSPAGRKYKGGY